jgi:uncharacterized membrane protein
MSDKSLILVVFDSESAADRAAERLKESELARHESIGILALDEAGALKMDKVGARSSGKGAGIGALLWLIGPVGFYAGVVGGSLLGALHHKGLGLDENDRDRIVKELEGGHAAVGVLMPAEDAAPVTAYLASMGGVPETHAVSDEALDHAHQESPS